MKIDLHLHTTASDGRSTPAELVALAVANGLSVMAVTDHDTVAAVDQVRTLAAAHGIESVPGIEITAVDGGRDVHMLGYFVDPADAGLAAFLAAARQSRVARLGVIAARLESLGMPIDTSPIAAQAERNTGRSVGRPLVARAMVAAGHVKDVTEAFDRWLTPGKPAFVPRAGATPEEVIAVVHAAGGLVSLAHPGRTKIDARLPALGAAGLDAIEVFHSDHDAADVERYAAQARQMGLLVTGGSDFHGDSTHGLTPGAAGPPAAEWARLSAARERYVRR